MGEMYEETGLMVILSIGAIGIIGALRFKSAVGIPIDQLGNLVLTASISGVMVGGAVYFALYGRDDWTQFLAAAMAGISTLLIGSGIWLNTNLSIRLSMVSGGLLAVIGLYLGRAAFIKGVKWVAKKTMRSSSSQRSLSSGSTSARRKTTADHIIDHHQSEDSASPTKQQNRIEAMKQEQERINRRNRKR